MDCNSPACGDVISGQIPQWRDEQGLPLKKIELAARNQLLMITRSKLPFPIVSNGTPHSRQSDTGKELDQRPRQARLRVITHEAEWLNGLPPSLLQSRCHRPNTGKDLAAVDVVNAWGLKANCSRG